MSEESEIRSRMYGIPAGRDEVAQFHGLVLKKVQLVCVDRLELKAITFDSSMLADFIGNTLTVRLIADLAGNVVNRVDTDGEYVSATWWDAVKERWCPAWWLARWPIRQRWIARGVVYQHVCPHALKDDLAKHLAFLAERHQCPPETSVREKRRRAGQT